MDPEGASSSALAGENGGFDYVVTGLYLVGRWLIASPIPSLEGDKIDERSNQRSWNTRDNFELRNLYNI